VSQGTRTICNTLRRAAKRRVGKGRQRGEICREAERFGGRGNPTTTTPPPQAKACDYTSSPGGEKEGGRCGCEERRPLSLPSSTPSTRYRTEVREWLQRPNGEKAWGRKTGAAESAPARAQPARVSPCRSDFSRDPFCNGTTDWLKRGLAGPLTKGTCAPKA